MERSYPQKRSAVNVCLNNLVKSVKCDHPCSEGYEVVNLISNNFLERNKGFLVERFIKPPVTLTFEFTSVIDLKYMIIECNVGAQKSSGIQLSIQPFSSEHQYESVCSGVLEEDQKGFVFHRYREDVKYKSGEKLYFCSLKSARNLSHVKSLKIKIFRTQDSSVPALGKVDIWGVPRKILPQIESSSVKSQNLSHTIEGNEIKSRKPSRPSLEFSSERSSLSIQYDGGSKSVEVPSDFIDPITCDIMCQPVTLPSGKVIDISTLELFEKAESQWGRGPSDPFTGIPFTSSSKPIVASDLKARIDKFLCDNSNHPELKKIPRTVGRILVPTQKLALKPTVSKLITDKGPIQHCSLSNNASFTTNGSYYEEPVKRRKVEENENQICFLGASVREMLTQPKNSEISSVASSKKPTTSFQERMEKSLELSLKSTLSSLPSFTADDEECDEKSHVECSACKLCNNLFTIPCSHFICRNCLISCKSKGSLSCSLCKSSFKSCDVQKVHISK